MDGDQHGGESSRGNEGVGQMQKQVDQVVSIMSQNIEKVKEREGRLDELDERAKRLDMTANVFHNTTKTVRRKMWWRNKRYIMILGGVASLIILIVIIPSVRTETLLQSGIKNWANKSAHLMRSSLKVRANLSNGPFRPGRMYIHREDVPNDLYSKYVLNLSKAIKR